MDILFRETYVQEWRKIKRQSSQMCNQNFMTEYILLCFLYSIWWLPLQCFGSQTHYNACSATKKYKDDSSKCKRTLRNLFTAAECSLLCWQIFTDCLCPFYIFWLVFLRGNYWTIPWNLWKHSSWIVLSFVCLYSSSSLNASPVPLRKCIFICSTGRAF